MTNEVNFDGLVGPTHHFSGLSYGNTHGTNNAGKVSYPKKAALQGLDKMKLLHDMGYPQGIIPPQVRPYIEPLKELWYRGKESRMVKRVAENNYSLASAIHSASSMWVANAATVIPSVDSINGKINFIVANLKSNYHRSIEAPQTIKLFKDIFRDPSHFTIHAPIETFGDEGAANHTRLCEDYNSPGLHLFMYGKVSNRSDSVIEKLNPDPSIYPARQDYEASKMVSMIGGLHSLNSEFYKQNAKAVDSGVFHNDVCGVGNLDFYMYHEFSIYGSNFQETVKNRFCSINNSISIRPTFLEVKNDEVSIEKAVETYLFNSQILKGDNGMILIAPTNCEQDEIVSRYINKVLEDKTNPLNEVKYVDLTQSLMNGGGPACLRLRVVMTEDELKSCNQNYILNNSLYDRLCSCVDEFYRDEVEPDALGNLQLYKDFKKATEEIYKIFDLTV
jgi:succinylarginine dihydrolase